MSGASPHRAFSLGEVSLAILVGDNRSVLSSIPENSIDSIVTDSPYGLKFMSKSWDKNVPDRNQWELCFRVLKPGGFLVNFSNAKTYHKMASQVDDAGFEIRDMLMWVYSSGIPKSKGCLSPAHDPIILARKPFERSLKKNKERWGTGDLQVERCRIPFEGQGSAKDGRFPKNFLHDGSEEVSSFFPEAPGSMAPVTKRNGPKFKNTYGKFHGIEEKGNNVRGDTGSASRFFYCAKPSPSERGSGNTWPTVKPIMLMRYLCRLVTPPGGLILDPWMGSGTTLIAATMDDFSSIGVEQDPEAIEIATNRIRDFLGNQKKCL